MGVQARLLLPEDGAILTGRMRPHAPILAP